MNASSPMKVVHEGRRIKLYRAEKGVHSTPGLLLWCGFYIGHARLWPPKLIRDGTRWMATERAIPLSRSAPQSPRRK